LIFVKARSRAAPTVSSWNASLHGRTGWSAFVYGSETHDVLVNSDIPTLVYR